VTHDSDRHEADRRRLRGFLAHLVGYFVVMAALVALNFAVDAEEPWYVWPMVGWGGVLAFHVAYAMGLFGSGTS
jgi:hypothetical protein